MKGPTMPRADEGRAGTVADALWRALRPHAIELLGVALACQAGADRPDGDAELTADEHARVDAAVAKFRQRSKHAPRQRRPAGRVRETKNSRGTVPPTQQGGEP